MDNKSVEAPLGPVNTASGFSSFLTQTTLHILIEMMALVGIVVYFTKKINKLTKQVEDLNTRLEEQEESIANHDEVLKKIISRLNVNVNIAKSSSIKKPTTKAQKEVSVKTPSPPPQPQPPVVEVMFQQQSHKTPGPNIMDIFGTLMTGNMSAPAPSSLPSESFIQELNEEENLDDELEEELKDLDSTS